MCVTYASTERRPRNSRRSRGEKVVPAINRIAQRFRNVVLTQDWHPKDHVSFASNHANKRPFDRIELAYGAQWINFNTFRIVEVYSVVTPIYLVTGYVILGLLRLVERRFAVR